MKMIDAVTAMSALAHEGRLDLFRRLIRAGQTGMAVGELVDACQQNFSTVSAQLLTLSNAGLVGKNREGRSIIYFANYDAMRNLMSFLMKDCCQGNAQIISPLAALANASACEQE